MFKNPIQGAPGEVCKKFAGIVYHVGIIYVGFMLMAFLYALFFNDNLLQFFAVQNKNIIETCASFFSGVGINAYAADASGISATVVFLKVMMFVAQLIWSAKTLAIVCLATLGLNVIGDAVNSLSAIAYGVSSKD